MSDSKKTSPVEQLKKKAKYKILTPTLARRGIVSDNVAVAKDLKKSVSLIRSILAKKESC